MSKPKKSIQPHWRPNFRNASTLPDIKVIRTEFVINFVAVLLVLVFGAMAVQREYRAFSLGGEIAEMEASVEAGEPLDTAHLKLSERFREAGRHVEELQKFYDTPFSPEMLLVGLAQLKPEDLIFSSFSFSEAIVKKKGKGKRAVATTSIQYKISLSGDVRGLTVLDEFKGAVRESSLLEVEGYDLAVDESVQQRDAMTGIVAYKISVSLVKGKDSTKAKGEKK